MKHFTYTDINGRTQYGTIYDNTSKVDCSNIHLHADESCFSRPACVLGYHIKLDMILAFILWLVITIAFGAEINLIAWMIGGFVYHIIKNIIKLKKHGTSKMHLYCKSIYFYGRNKCDMHCCHADTAFFIATARPLNCY